MTGIVHAKVVWPTLKFQELCGKFLACHFDRGLKTRINLLIRLVSTLSLN